MVGGGRRRYTPTIPPRVVQCSSSIPPYTTLGIPPSSRCTSWLPVIAVPGDPVYSDEALGSDLTNSLGGKEYSAQRPLLC